MKSVDSKCDIDRNRPDIAMKLHSYAINSASVDRLYSGNNCLESIKKQNHIIDGISSAFLPSTDLNCKSFSNISFITVKPLFLHYSTTGMLNSYSIG